MLGKALLFSFLATAGAHAAPTSDPTPTSGLGGDSLTLTLNIPTYKLEVRDGSEVIRSYWVTIGMPEYPTPTGSFKITRIEWNPRWVPPSSPWAKGKTEKAPGKGNPMGRVKLQFDDFLYVHGTWRPDELGGPYSHGCVRLKNEDALDLARLIAERQQVLTDAQITALERNSTRTRSVRLPTPIPIRIRYGLTDEVDGKVVDNADPYGWATQGASAPAETGDAASDEIR
jgi:murein L,D-transpeptidase YcbB/YkuD